MKFTFLKASTGVLFVFLMLVSVVSSIAQPGDGFDAMNNGATDSTQLSTSENDWFTGSTATTDSIQTLARSEESERAGTVYPLTEIGGVTLLLYLITWLLSRFKVFKKSVHRKLWNVILLISFMVSGLLGLMLVVQINYDVMGEWYSTFMWLHVDFGIVMAIISIFHILWHTKYFATIMKNKKH